RRMGAVYFIQRCGAVQHFIAVPAPARDPPGGSLLTVVNAKLGQLVNNIQLRHALVWHFVTKTEAVIKQLKAQRKRLLTLRVLKRYRQFIVLIDHGCTLAPRLLPALVNTIAAVRRNFVAVT